MALNPNKDAPQRLMVRGIFFDLPILHKDEQPDPAAIAAYLDSLGTKRDEDEPEPSISLLRVKRCKKDIHVNKIVTKKETLKQTPCDSLTSPISMESSTSQHYRYSTNDSLLKHPSDSYSKASLTTKITPASRKSLLIRVLLCCFGEK